MLNDSEIKREQEIKREAHFLHTESNRLYRKLGNNKPLTDSEIKFLNDFDTQYFKLEEAHSNLYTTIQFYYKTSKTGKSW